MISKSKEKSLFLHVLLFNCVQISLCFIMIFTDMGHIGGSYTLKYSKYHSCKISRIRETFFPYIHLYQPFNTSFL